VFVLDLGVEEDPVAELVAGVKHDAHEVELVPRGGGSAVLAPGGEVLVERFPVAADRDASRNVRAVPANV
jgi:hypothetical protein